MAFEREFLRTAFTLAASPEVQHLLYVHDRPVPPELLRGRRCRRKLIYAVTSDAIAKELRPRKERVVVIPTYEYSRVDRVKVALVSVTAAGLIKPDEIVLCLTGRSGKPVDTMMQIKIGSTDEEAPLLEGIHLDEKYNPQVIDAVLKIAMEIGQEGFEGHAIGTIFTIGDATSVLEKSRQMMLNPFQGISESERNVLDPKIREAVKRLAVLDGAFVLREDGVVLAAGRYLSSAGEDVKIPLGLGARHAAAAAITRDTVCITVVVSQTSGSVRFFKEGHTLLELHQTSRRT